MKKEDKVSTAVIVQALKKEADKSIKKLNAITIDSQDSYDKAAALVKELKLYAQTAKEKEDKILNPMKEAVNEVKALFTPFYKEVQRLEADTKTAMVAWLEELEAEKLKLQEKFDSGKIKRVSTLMGKQAEFSASSNENSSVRNVKVLDIVDENKIPRKFLVPDETAIRKALLAGETVPGCKLEVKKSISI